MIFLIRHGEAAAGWGDHPDPGLSDLGKSQADVVAGMLAERGATAVVSSPMQRCRETSAPLAARLGVSPLILSEVSEIATPPGTANRVGWLRAIMAGTWTEAGDGLAAWRAAIGERVDALPDGTAVFSHFVAINALAGLLENDDRVTVFRPGHCSVTVVAREDGRLRVTEFGSEAATRVL